MSYYHEVNYPEGLTPYCLFEQKKIKDMKTCPLIKLNKARHDLINLFSSKSHLLNFYEVNKEWSIYDYL